MTLSPMAAWTADEAALTELRVEHARLARRLAVAEREGDRLSMTAVALLRLYESGSADDLLAAVRDVLVNLAGVEAFELHASAAAGDVPAPVAVAGADRAVLGPARFAALAHDVVRTAAPQVVSTPCAKAPHTGGAALACIPLLWHGAPLGALVILRLLPHKPALTLDDLELFELLRTHLLPALSAATGRAAKAAPRWTVT